MLNQALEHLAVELNLRSDAYERLRLEFAYACVARVTHLLEYSRVLECFAGLQEFLEGNLDAVGLAKLAEDAARLAREHQGSKSIDGCGHAAVSASYAVAKALAGDAIQAADYAAYATVYAQGGSAAVGDRDSFGPELAWQASCLRELAARHGLRGST